MVTINHCDQGKQKWGEAYIPEISDLGYETARYYFHCNERICEKFRVISNA